MAQTWLNGHVGPGVVRFFDIRQGRPVSRPALWLAPAPNAACLSGCCYHRALSFEVSRAMKRIRLVKWSLIGCCVAAFAGCGLFPAWHWAKPGAGEAEYAFDEAQCKAKVYAGTDGTVTNASVRRMHGCMEAKGWVKTPN